MSLYCMALAKPRRQSRVNVLCFSLSLSLFPVSILSASLAAEFAFAEVYFAGQEVSNISARST